MNALQLVKYAPELSSALRSCRGATATKPIPTSAREVLVKVSAASVNPIDVLMAKGYGASLFTTMDLAANCGAGTKLTNDRLPLTLGRDFVGTIVQTGPQVPKKFSKGDRVWGCVQPHSQFGSHAQYTLTDYQLLDHAPENLTDLEAAAIPYAGLTAWCAIRLFGQVYPHQLKDGAHTLVLGGTGGLGSLAIQMLKAWGAHVTATCSTEAIEWCYEQTGADTVVDYNNPLELETMANQFDLILDFRPPPTAHGTERSAADETILSRLHDGASFVTTSSPLIRNTDQWGMVLGTAKSLINATLDTVSSKGSYRWAFWRPSQSGLQELTNLASAGKLKAIIDSTYSLDDAVSAYQRVAAGHLRGKVVIDLSQKSD